MRKSRNLLLLSIASLMVVWGITEFRIYAGSSAPTGGIVGPDVIVGDLPSVMRHGTQNGLTGYSIGTTSCNVGDEPLAWIADSDQHPVISQNLYRIKDGRIEQLGQSWLKHGFFALDGSLCDTCQALPGGTALGIGCSDPYSASLNGSQGPLSGGTGGLGPKSEVNATTGEFAWPCRRLTSQERGVLGGRIQVANSDLDPSQNAGALYYIESQYVQPEDAAAGNDLNNASHRRVNVSGSGSTFNLFPTGPTIRTLPAIHAWQEAHPDVKLIDVDIPGDGRVIAGLLTTETDTGFHTEVAIYNLNSHQSVRSLSLENCVGQISDPGFNGVAYHAEPYSDSGWTPSIIGGQIEWSTETFQDNQDANALRWGTLYSFWYDSENPPVELTLGLFRPGKVQEVSVPLVLFGDVNMDGLVNLLDVDPFVNLLSGDDYQAEADLNCDGAVNLLDVAPFVEALGGGN